MKRKVIAALLMAAVMALSAVNLFALDYYVPEDAESVTMRFFLLEPDDLGDEFLMVSEDGELVINISENTLIYFEDFVPLSDECEGMTQMVREVLFGRTLAEVLEGRNLRVIFEDAEQIEPVSIMILFERFMTLPEEIDPEDILLIEEQEILELPEDFDPEESFIIDEQGFVALPEEIEFEYGFIYDEQDFDPIPLNGEIVVNNVILESEHHPFWQEDKNVVMVPLRVVADALD